MKLFYLFFIISTNLFGAEFENYLKVHNDQFIKYQKDIDADFKAYKKVYDEALSEYKSEIGKKWATTELSTNTKWVEYSNNYGAKKVVDYQKMKIYLSVIAKNRKEGEQKIGNLFDELYEYDVNKGFLNDKLEQKISKKLDKGRNILSSNEKLISDMMTKDEQKNLKNTIIAPMLKEVNFNENLIYTMELHIPKDRLLNKEKLYISQVSLVAKRFKLNSELIFAIIKNESSFNPLAKSYVPAFGLMQIVPQTGGVDAYENIYGMKKLLSGEFLFDPNNNILIGSSYLDVLMSKQLKGIKNQKSKLYCAIASYNGGSTRVASAFGFSKIKDAFFEINKMSDDEIYKKLIKDLPSNETKKYLFKVRQSMEEYEKLIKSGVLAT